MDSGIQSLENDLVQAFAFSISFEDTPGHTAIEDGIEDGYIWEGSTWSVKLDAAVVVLDE